MSSHPELEQLSAYLDAELDATDHTALEAHLPACAECRSILAALRATIADLGELPEAAPTEQDSWALRSAISRARTPVKRWQRAAWAAGAVAAAAIAVVAIVQPGGGRQNAELASGGAEGAGAPAANAGLIVYDAGAFTAGSAQAKLLVVSGKTGEGQVQDASAPSPTEKVARPLAGSATTSDRYARAAGTTDATKEIDRCVAQIKKSTQEYLRPVEYDVGTFESKPAFLLFFQVESRFELWVVERPSCTTLYFAQAA